jgi:hypothetical protein
MKIFPVLLGLLLSATASSAQSLAEIAEKERQRREKLPPSKVIRDADLAASGGKGVSIAGKEAGADIRAPEVAPIEPIEEDPESDWPRVFASCQARFDAAKAVRDEKMDLIVTGLPIGADLKPIPCYRIRAREFLPGWIRYAIDCETLENEVKEQEALMKEIQEECLNEARIRNIPPGAARLQ